MPVLALYAVVGHITSGWARSNVAAQQKTEEGGVMPYTPNVVNHGKPTAQQRKETPVYSGVDCYFPDALLEVARVSWQGNEQHNPGQPLHWSRGKSDDHDDASRRHKLDVARGEKFDTDGTRHRAKVVWRELAALQLEIEQEGDDGRRSNPEED